MSKEKPRILLVEDNLLVSTALQDILSEDGFEIQTAGTGKEAEALIKDISFSLVLLDLMLPDTNGFILCAEIRNTPAISHIPVIITTGLADREDVVKAHQAGANDYIVKPFTLITVMEKVDKFLPEH